MRVSTSRLVAGFTNVLVYGGLGLLVTSLVLDRSWILNWQFALASAAGAFVLRSLSITLGKYSYISPSAIVAISGALLVGPVTTALGVSIGTAISDRVIYQKSPWAVLVNIGREVIGLFVAFGCYAATISLSNATSPLSPEGVPALLIFALSYFVFWRWLFYFTLLIRGKLSADERQLMFRYEIITGGILTAGAATVIFSALTLPVAGWVFMSALFVPVGMLVKRMLEEAIRAEELNKLHAMDAIVSGAISLNDSLVRIERLAHKILDWGDFRIFRRENTGANTNLVYRGLIGRRDRGQPPVEFEELRESVFTDGAPIVIRHSAGDPRTATLPDHIASGVVYPIKLGEDVIGTFELEHHKPGTYRREHMSLLDACANRIATAMHIADLRRPLLDTVERIGTEVRNLRDVAGTLGKTASDIRSGSATISANLAKQESDVNSSLEDAERLNAEGRVVATGGASAATASAEASYVADQSRATLTGAVEKLAGVKEFVADSADKVDEVGQLARSIVTRVGSIREHANLTQLLALNAGIDLARETNGENGFGVVANEIRELADQTGAAALEVVDLVSRLRGRLGDVHVHLRRGRVSVMGAETMGANGLENLESVVDATRGATAEARRIALSAEGQRSALQGLRGRMAAVADFSKQNRQAAEQLIDQSQFAAERLTEVGNAIGELESIAAMLAELTDRFTFVDTDHHV